MATPYGASQDVTPSFSISTQPPAPPPKPSSQGVSRRNTPAGGHGVASPPPEQRSGPQIPSQSMQVVTQRDTPHLLREQDPGEYWLPASLEHKSKQDVADALENPKLVSALAHAPSTVHPSMKSSEEPLQAALAENIALATHLEELEGRLNILRESTQAQLLSTHAVERQWRQKQLDMDRALSPFSPSSLYQRLNQGVQEQEMICRALEDSFLDGDGEVASEREVTDWVRRYRDAKKTYYARKERKERWDEGRVGGWR